MMDFPDFVGFPKIHRLARPCIVTEKIDGTNGQIYILETREVFVGSRTRWLTLENDNFGFAAWVYQHVTELVDGLGPGRHFGEWWGKGIQRNYELTERRFSLFNTERWLVDERPVCPPCCHVVPIVARVENFARCNWDAVMDWLSCSGSLAAPGFYKPEGIVVYHPQGNVSFKRTFDKDQTGKERA
jgi:hypothetical protein